VFGWFAGDIPLKFDLEAGQSFQESLQQFKSAFKDLPAGGLTYETLANQGKLPRVDAICPVRLNYQPFTLDAPDMDIESALFESVAHDRLYLLDVIIRLQKTGCLLIVRCSKHCHKRAAIEQFVQRWLEIMNSAL